MEFLALLLLEDHEAFKLRSTWGIRHLGNALAEVLNAAQFHVVQQLKDSVDGLAKLTGCGGAAEGCINGGQLFAKGVIGSAAMGFPFSGAFTDATVFGDGAWMRFVLPLRLVDLYTENGAVQVLTAWAVDFCF